MKKINHALSVFALSSSLFLLPTVTFAFGWDGGKSSPADRLEARQSAASSQPEIVKWSGIVMDEASSHTTAHEHELKFIKNDDGDSFDIKDSPELVKLHHETEKNYVVEIEAEKTPKFLFWGGNLVVKSYKVVQAVGERVPHHAIPVEAKTPRRFFERPGHNL